ncbi:hypothetical protein FOC1_g10005430 [Fusarium oxysporum f. sp. cubense race 1]|uniref:WSC domain-containing protein n=1 Tax=Fusarium oxysporum f. sp. cubense (strain race 1) TaxID=1229664 RepID=N4UJP2_FUSC1|nr:hypothetical protein FOC1_g10005430 [Fusarium oxysporum f. sp. cubense race 1]
MRFTNPKFLAVFTALPLLANCFSITETTDYDTVASVMFAGPGLTIMAVTVLGESSMGTFTDGPFGLGSGGILTSGTATGAYLMGNRNVDNGVGAGGQYDYLCAPGTQNINTLQVQLGFDPGYNGVRIEFVFATQEAPSALANMDAISILDASNGPPVQYAFDSNANQINALSPFLLAPDAIFPPDSLTGYTRSSPPLVRTIPAPSGGAMVLMISVCDVGDAFNDSGFLVRAEACVDCDYGLDKVEINYAFETSTLPPGEQPFTSTIPASGTASGTFIVFVEPTGVTTTTSAEPTTTTTDDFTTTTGEVTTTMDESLTTAETTITTIDELTITELVSTTETMTLVVDETTTTTADVTTESGSTIEATATTEQSATAVTSELETLTTDEVSTSMADTTTSIQIESPASTDTKSVPSTTSEFASTSVDQGPVLASDTTTSESAVSTTEELITSTAASTSASSSVIPEASSESTPSSLVSTVLPSISSTSTSFAEEGKTSTLEVVPDTTSAPVEPVTSMSQESPTISSSDAPPATSSPFDGLSNIDTIREYTYKGCLGSADGYPSFNLVGSGANMTTASCVALARGRAYVGIYDRQVNIKQSSCYASDSLDATSLVLNGRCDIPCPGDSSHFCGGLVVSSSERRWVGPRKALDTRAAPADILLTLYALNDEPPSPGETSTEVEVTATTQDGVTAIPTDVIPSRPVTTVTDIMTESVILQPVETAIDSITRSGQTLVETTVTTVTYTIVNPNNPSTMTVTEYCATLFYEPCSRCAHPPVPTVEMTTYVVPCNACGHNGENEVTTTAPCAAVTEPARNDAHGSQDLFNAFAPTRAACHAVSGPVRTVTTALRDTKPTAGAGSGHIESATPNQHQPSEGKNTYPGAGHAQPHAVPSQSSSGASGNGSAVPEVLVAEAGRYERGILGSLTMVFIAVGVLL